MADLFDRRLDQARADFEEANNEAGLALQYALDALASLVDSNDTASAQAAIENAIQELEDLGSRVREYVSSWGTRLRKDRLDLIQMVRESHEGLKAGLGNNPHLFEMDSVEKDVLLEVRTRNVQGAPDPKGISVPPKPKTPGNRPRG